MWLSFSCCRCVELLVGGEWVGRCRWAMKVRDVDAGCCLAAWLARRQSCFFTTTTAAAINTTAAAITTTTITTNVFWATTKLSPHRLLPDHHHLLFLHHTTCGRNEAVVTSSPLGWHTTLSDAGSCPGHPSRHHGQQRGHGGASSRKHRTRVLHLECHPPFRLALDI